MEETQRVVLCGVEKEVTEEVGEHKNDKVMYVGNMDGKVSEYI